MTIWQSIVLGVIQGLTEFLPISSSGHLVLVPTFLNWQIPSEDAFLFDVLVQIATLFAVIIYFWSDLVRIFTGVVKSINNKESWQDEDVRLGWLIIIATIPAGIFGLLFKDIIEASFNSAQAVGVFLIITALLLIAAERIGKSNRDLKQLNWKDALIVGLFQSLATLPGISRSGSTMCGGMVCHLHRKDAAKFSFLMSIPIMLAAGLLESINLLQAPNLNQLLPVFIPGFIASGITGYLSIRWLLKFLTRHRLDYFSVYLIILGMATFVFTRV
ncbi:MAG: undecaprenyl-diphosphatase UppP [Anaerolineales bacterium]|nr:undecaprenyl-diphosphatase UppP [Anaerolineales bacterium]